VVKLRQFFSIPIIAIDDAMCQKAVENSSHLAVLATAQSTVKPTLEKLESEGQLQKKEIALTSFCCPEALAELKKGNREKHDILVLDMAKKVSSVDGIVLAQASMAHLQSQVQELTLLQTYSSPLLCMHAVAAMLEGLNGQ
jgi:Asp/Glu/hydantoin racemase